MVRGFCMSCDRLVAIKPGAQKWGSRECEWRPFPHERPVHRGCGGPLADYSNMDDVPDVAPIYACVKCGENCIQEDDVERVPCDGDTRDIR